MVLFPFPFLAGLQLRVAQQPSGQRLDLVFGWRITTLPLGCYIQIQVANHRVPWDPDAPALLLVDDGQPRVLLRGEEGVDLTSSSRTPPTARLVRRRAAARPSRPPQGNSVNELTRGWPESADVLPSQGCWGQFWSLIPPLPQQEEDDRKEDHLAKM
ncbi:hypothetical protein U9M48_014470 [Paspalum notatum var. saurae]|uniref:Uncharacterized protein n=1 Tax=Paspalum notatum var. saurae TaxID=547442 RepID=A0AAQ3T1A1_PASNO